MDTLRDYIARTQQDRIALDTLAALEEIRDILKTFETKLNFAQNVLPVETTPNTVKSAPKKSTTTKRKPKGDK